MAGLEAAFERIGEAVERHLPASHAPGLALAITDRDDILGVVVRGFADVAAQKPVRPDTRFQIGSISKSFAAICVLQEVEAGRLDLHVSVNDLLPWLDLPEPFGPITLHHLMTHTSGLAIGTEESPTGPGAIAIARTVPPTFPPGERYVYSNDGYKLVGAVLERVTGTLVADLIPERIFGPLGMTSSEARITNETRLDLSVGYEPVYDERPANLEHPLAPAWWIVTESADGAIVSTVADMSAYARMFLGRGATTVNGSEVQLLSEAMFETFTTPYTATDDPKVRYAYALDISEEEDGRIEIGHGGGMVGYTAAFWLDTGTGLGCTILQNGSGDKAKLVDASLDAVRASLAGKELPPTPSFDPRDIEQASPLAGAYSGERSIELVADATRLRLIEADVSVELQRWGDEKDAFCVPHPSWDRFLLRVLRGADGEVTELVHGPQRFAPPGRDLDMSTVVPPEWADYPGTYRSNDPWASVMVIFSRAGALWLLWPPDGIESPLSDLGDGTFAVGEEWQPQRLRFEDVVEGRPSIAWYNGGRWYRMSG